jgi:hypothetical protein
MNKLTSTHEMKLENQLEAYPVIITTISLVTHFHGPYFSPSPCAHALLCQAGILLSPGIDRNMVKAQQRTSDSLPSHVQGHPRDPEFRHLLLLLRGHMTLGKSIIPFLEPPSPHLKTGVFSPGNH